MMRQPAIPSAHRRAFTLVDTLMTVAVLAIIAGLALATMSPTERTRVVSAAALFASDVEHARMISLTTPANPGVVRSAADGASYWVARTDTTETEIPAAGGRKFRVVFGEAPATGMTGVKIALTAGGAVAAGGGGIVQFDGFGRIRGPATDALFELSLGGVKAKVKILSDTGDVSIE
ncbi:MAG: Tfp pilus assembly protein FimT/FimU [Phycisphaerales bacterium]